MTLQVLENHIDIPKILAMSTRFRPLEAELFLLIEQRRERMGYDHITNFYAWALNKDPHSAYRQYLRLKKTVDKTEKTTENAHLSIEDASNLARALQIDLSTLIRQAEEKLGLDNKPFPIPSASRLSKKKKSA